MKILRMVLALLVLAGSAWAAPIEAPVTRNSITTNSHPAASPSATDVLLWDPVNGYWKSGSAIILDATQFGLSGRNAAIKIGAVTTNGIVWVTNFNATLYQQPHWTSDPTASDRPQLVTSNGIPIITVRYTNDSQGGLHSILYLGGGNTVNDANKRFEGIHMEFPNILDLNSDTNYTGMAMNFADVFAYGMHQYRFLLEDPPGTSGQILYNGISTDPLFTALRYGDAFTATRLFGRDLTLETTVRSFGISNIVINLSASTANALAKFAGTAGNIVQNTALIALSDNSLYIPGTITNLSQVFSGTVVTNRFLYLGSGGIVLTGTFSTGLTFSGGVLTSSGGGTPGGYSTSPQWNQAGSFSGMTNWVYDISNGQLVGTNGGQTPLLKVIGVGFGGVGLNSQGLIQYSNAAMYLGVNGSSNWNITASGHWLPTANVTGDVGAPGNQVRGGYFQTTTASNYLFKALPLAQVSTSLTADGAYGTLFTNQLSLGSSGGTTNIDVAGIQDGQTLLIKVWPTNGVQATLLIGGSAPPADWYTDKQVVGIVSNAWNWIYVSRAGGTTNIAIFNPGFQLAVSAPVTITTNFNVDPPTITIGSSGGTATTQMVATAIGNLTMTNQITYIVQEFNGSNTVNDYAWDMTLNTYKLVTNFVNTNMVFTLSNITRTASLFCELIGNPGTTNTVLLKAVSGVNIKWKGWNTNNNGGGIYVRGGYSYSLQATADRTTNVSAWVTTDDPYAVGPIISIVTNDIAINVRYTNTASTVSYVQCSMTLNAGVTDIAQAVLLIDQNGDGTWDAWITNRIGSGVAMADSILMGGWVTNSGIFMITNQSTGSATATINPNSSQRISGFGTGPQGLTGPSGVQVFNSLPQSQTNYLPVYDRRMSWGAYFPNNNTTPVGQGNMGGMASVGTLQNNMPASETNSQYGVIRATGGSVRAGVQPSHSAMFVPTNRVFLFTATLGFSNAPGTNEMHMEIVSSAVQNLGTTLAPIGWFAETKGSAQTNWTAMYRSNNTTQINVYTSTAMTDQWHTLGIGNTNGSTLVWYLDGVPVATLTTPGLASPGGVGCIPLIGEQATANPGPCFMFWQDFELLHEKTTPVSTGPL